MAAISSSTTYLNALASTNWLQSAATANASNGNDWIDSANSPNNEQQMGASFANAIATALQNQTSSSNSTAINNALTTLESQAAGQSVNLLT